MCGRSRRGWAIDRQRQMQEIMTNYVREAMVKDHHYYSFTEGGKPALTKDGAYRICSLFKVTPGPVDVEIERHDDGHYTVTSLARLFNQDGVEIASSRGVCLAVVEARVGGMVEWVLLN